MDSIVNLTNDNQKAIDYFLSSKLQPFTIMMQLCVNIDSIPEDSLAFDVQQLSIALLSNSIEKSEANRIALRDVGNFWYTLALILVRYEENNKAAYNCLCLPRAAFRKEIKQNCTNAKVTREGTS